MAWQVLVPLSVFLPLILGQISYSIPEEMAKGALVGNIAQDLGLDLRRLQSGRARIYTADSIEYIGLNKDSGLLFIAERIDREALCGKTTPCALGFQVILENPIEFYHVNIDVTDINDNTPFFKKSEVYFEISESTPTGAKFVLEQAMDHDVGTNDLQRYSLKPTDHFDLKYVSQPDGGKIVELVLQKPLDREGREHLSLELIAIDGGEPQLFGTSQIYVTVLDANDNAPVFTQPVVKASVKENSPKGFLVATVEATDLDQNVNGKVKYSITNTLDGVSEMFAVDVDNGTVYIVGLLDYEKVSHYKINVRASDHGGLTDSCKVVVEIIDVNDNSPVIKIMSKSTSLSEDIKPGTVVSVINVQDPDSNENGKVRCSITDSIPFALKSSSNNFFSLIVDGGLDRESVSEYNISLICSDEGQPSLSSSVNILLDISDVNDNPPVFEKSLYHVSIFENNSPGASISVVKAGDGDWKQNAHVTYLLEDSTVNGVAVSSYVSVTADSGVIKAARSFDFEQVKDFQILVKAQDGGSPPLSSNATVKISILDQNDNSPQILYPVESSSSVVTEVVPRAADVGYLVTKVVAVDVDSGHNAWLSFKLVRASDRALFEVGLQNGEIRTIRQVADKDAVKQKLTVVVEDNGQPPRSATVNVNVALTDSYPQVLSEFSEFSHDKEYNENLTFYLVLALAVVSFLFIISVIAILSVRCYRWRRERMFYKSSGNLPVIPYYPPLYADVGGTGTLQHVYNYEVCRTTDSRKSDLKHASPRSQSIISLDMPGPLTHGREKADSEDFTILVR